MNPLVIVNPRRKRRGRKRRRTLTAKQERYFGKHRRRSRRVSRRRNPLGSVGFGRFNLSSFLNNDLIPASIGAGGAFALDAGLGFVRPYLPATFQSGIGNAAVRIAGAVAVGWVAGMALGGRVGQQAASGALIVTMYDLLKPYAAQVLPLSGYPTIELGWPGSAYQLDWEGPDDGMGAYVPENGMGAYMDETGNY